MNDQNTEPERLTLKNQNASTPRCIVSLDENGRLAPMQS